MVYFQTKNPNLGKFWRVLLAMKDVGIFYDHMVYFNAIPSILWPFGIFCGHFGTIFQFWYICRTKKNLATLAA
jgi:hypothetical protein